LMPSFNKGRPPAAFIRSARRRTKPRRPKLARAVATAD
jgi:hypothetical protein